MAKTYVAPLVQDMTACFKNELLHGWVRKKSPSGIPGFRPWQERYLRFLARRSDPKGPPEFLSYFKTQDDTEPLDNVSLKDIKRALFLPNKRAGCRFDVVTSERVYAFDCDEIDDAEAWVKAINACVAHLRSNKNNLDRQEENKAPTGPTTRWTQLQKFFFSVFFGTKIPEPEPEPETEVSRSDRNSVLERVLKGAKKVMPGLSNIDVGLAEQLENTGKRFEPEEITMMERDFPNDAAVLRYILFHALGPVVAAQDGMDESDDDESVADNKHGGGEDGDSQSDRSGRTPGRPSTRSVAELPEEESSDDGNFLSQHSDSDDDLMVPTEDAPLSPLDSSASPMPSFAPPPPPTPSQPGAGARSNWPTMGSTAQAGVNDKGTRSQKTISWGQNSEASANSSMPANSPKKVVRMTTSVRDRVKMLNAENLAKLKQGGILKPLGSSFKATIGQAQVRPPQPDRGAPRVASKGADIDLMLLEAIKSREFIRCVLLVFRTADKQAHGLAVTTLWFVSPIEFPQYAQIYCSGQHCHDHTTKALFDILLLKAIKVIDHVDEPLSLSMGQKVMNKETWAALFKCLAGCDFELRTRTLMDINSLLINNAYNCRSIELDRNWTKHVLPLLCDIEKSRKATQTSIKKLYAYVVNVLVLVNYEAFFQRLNNHLLLFETLGKIRSFAGHNDESQAVARTLLLSIVNKLASDKHRFPVGDYKSSVPWQNFAPFMTVCRRFVFQMSYWETPTALRKKTGANEPKAAAVKKPPTMGYQRRASVKKVQTLERKMTAHEEANSLYVLRKSRKGFQADNKMQDEPMLKDHGYHFHADGSAADAPMARKLATLFTSLNMGLDENSLEYAAEEDKPFLIWAKAEHEFWTQAAILLELVHRDAIEEMNILTYRELSFTVQEFLSCKSTQERASVCKRLSDKVFKSEASSNTDVSAQGLLPSSHSLNSTPGDPGTSDEPAVEPLLRKGAKRQMSLGAIHRAALQPAPQDNGI